MGVILSKFRRAKPSLEDQLEKIDKELTEIRRFQIDTEIEQKRIIGRLSIAAFSIYALAILAYYLFMHTETFTWLQHALSLLPFIIFPLIIWSLRRTFAWWYQRKIVQNREKTDKLRKDRERLLDEVMDTETFKVAKKILEKYAPSHLLPKYLADQQKSTPVNRVSLAGSGADGVRRRTTAGGPRLPASTQMHQLPLPGPGARPRFGGNPLRPHFAPPQQAIMGPPGTPNFRPTSAMSSVPTGFTPMRFMLPAPPTAPVIHNRKTGWMDKLVDYVVGDGPAHRYALICRYCATHNGLATPEDYPFTGYRCIYCRQFNPPKQQRPSAPTLPRNTVLIEEMDSSQRESSGIVESGDEDSAKDEDVGPTPTDHVHLNQSNPDSDQEQLTELTENQSASAQADGNSVLLENLDKHSALAGDIAPDDDDKRRDRVEVEDERNAEVRNISDTSNQSDDK